MKAIILFIPLALLAADKPLASATTEERLTAEVIGLKMQIVETQYREIQAAREKVVATICGRASIPVPRCRIDWKTGEVTATPEPPKPAAHKEK